MTDTRLTHWARRALVVDAWAFAATLLGQIFLAGMGVMVGPRWWLQHRAFVQWIQWLAPIALVLAYLARAPRDVKALAWTTLVLLWLQYTTSELRLVPGRQPWAALHPVNGVLLFWTATELARRASRSRGELRTQVGARML